MIWCSGREGFLKDTVNMCSGHLGSVRGHKLPVCHRMQNTALILKETGAYDEINLILVYLMALSVE
jgi:hypothetical protein